MKRFLLTITYIFLFFPYLFAKNTGREIDSLLQALDKAIADRPRYTLEKQKKIEGIKQLIRKEATAERRFRLQEDLISEYQSFKCDSALVYIEHNLELAKALKNTEYLQQTKLRLAFVLSLSGLFTQAREVLEEIDYSPLPTYLKLLYCWTYIRYHENLMKYSDKRDYERIYQQENRRYRDMAIGLLGNDSEMYLKEKAFKLKSEGAYQESADIQTELFRFVESDSHGYAMSAMSLSMIHEALGNTELEEKYLLLAAITDVRLAVKENESLLTLAIYLHQRNDVNRAYTYIQAALDDANFYNSRFRNAVIARTQPIIEATYLDKIQQQRHNLRLYALSISVVLVILIVTLYMLYKQIKKVIKARQHLNRTNEQLVLVNHRLDEANLIRERYIGHYINQCAVYLDKLDDFRKNVNRKIKAGQLEDLQRLSSSTLALERDAQELYSDFDRTFFEVYPNFVEEFNALLREEEQYKLKKDQLNTELRIFALIRLGITDVNQIAIFLRYSIQTIYNYKSKVKGKASIESDHFEEKVRKIGNRSAVRFE